MGDARLCEQDPEFRQVGIPLDQARPGPEPGYGLAEKFPYFIADPLVVRVDQYLAVFKLIDRVTGKVNFRHTFRWYAAQEFTGIEAVIAGVDEDVIDVQ